MDNRRHSLKALDSKRPPTSRTLRMQFNYYDLGYLKGGEMVEVTLSGSARRERMTPEG
ncbi:MAG TPA: hypothetical protein VES88_10140 [Gemmatimonadaceae bacterium]|nr:hypothetical protein [Gemmatimonadaceae bacterium]